MDNLSERNVQPKTAGDIEVSGFIKQLSHDIRTPMNTIVGSVELISRENVSDSVRESLIDIRQATDAITLMTDELIDLVRIVNNEITLSTDEYCFEDIILDVRHNIERGCERRGLDYEVTVDEAIPYRLFGDAFRITKMLNKIIGNAIDFTKEGKVSFSVKSMPGEQNKVFLRFDISDTGSGVLSDDIINVLNGKGMAFEQGMRGVEGAAIGVFLTKYFAAKMGGKLSVKATQGKGSTVTLLISQGTVGVATMGDHLESKTDKDDTQLAFTAENARVLIVEDNMINARIEHAILGQYKIDADIVDNGQGAIDLVKKIHYDLVLMDLMMPDIDGMETTAAIRACAKLEPDKADYYKKLPIIAFTANTDQVTVKKVLEGGLNDFLSKPVNVGELERVLRVWLPHDVVVFPAEFNYESKGLKVLEEMGLNTAQALANFDGDESEYREVLLTMCRSSDTKSKMLNYYLEQHDYKNYIVAVHGILGVAQVVGADNLASRCRELEKAAKQGLREILEKETPLFADVYEKLLSSIRNAIMTTEGNNVKDVSKGAIDRDDLLAIINELKGYLDEYQLPEVEDLFYTLAQFSYPNEKVMELIHEAEKYMLSYDYNEVTNTLNAIITELKSEE